MGNGMEETWKAIWVVVVKMRKQARHRKKVKKQGYQDVWLSGESTEAAASGANSCDGCDQQYGRGGNWGAEVIEARESHGLF